MDLIHVSISIFVGITLMFDVSHGGEHGGLTSLKMNQGNNKTAEQSSSTRINSDYCRHKYECDVVNKTFPVKGCHCDILCGLMDDCCKGFTSDATLTQSNSLTKQQFSCVDMHELTNNTLFGALMVTKCSSEWEDEESRKLCEKNQKRNSQFSSYYIVIDGIMFKNVFCAFCSGVINRSYDLNTVKMCSNYTLDKKIDNADNCKSLYFEMEHKVAFRWCSLKKVIEICFGEATDDLYENCTAGEHAVVYDALGNVFKNKYCGLCMSRKERTLFCDPLSGDVSVGEPYPFSKLVNINYDTSYNTDHTHVESHCPSVDNTKTNNKNESGESLCRTDEGTEKSKPKTKEKGEMYLTVLCLILSIVALTLTLFVYFLIPKLRTIGGKITCCLALSLLLAQLLYLVSSEAEMIKWLCISMAVLVHYFFLTAFCWMNVIAFDLMRTFSNRIFDISDKRLFRYYCLYAWCVPLIFVGGAIVLNFSDTLPSFNPHYGKFGCWISSTNALLLFFIAPLALFKAFDIIAFVCTTVYIAKTKRETRMAAGNRNACSLVLNIKLSLIMGLTWVFAFIATVSDNDIMWYLFIVFNTLQGVFIFICFICNKRVFKMVTMKYREFLGKSRESKSQTQETKV